MNSCFRSGIFIFIFIYFFVYYIIFDALLMICMSEACSVLLRFLVIEFVSRMIFLVLLFFVLLVLLLHIL